MNRRRAVLIVQHAPHEHPAALRRALETQGIQTQWIHPYRGEKYPAVSELAGMISLGGPMSANDDALHPWITREVALLRECVEATLPVAGICLGGQMLARALGGRVEKHRTAEVGWFPIELNAQGLRDPVLGAAGQNPTVYHWHGDTFHLPPGAELLASSQACERQAYRVSERVYGFQFHPEADHQLVLEWLGVEGTEQEILETSRQHGSGTVQDALSQRNHALKGEKSSLKITTAIAGLFRTRAISAKTQSSHEELQRFATSRGTVIVEFEGSARRAVQLRGKIAALLMIPAGEFVILEEENGLLWPIRVGDLLSVRAAPEGP